MNPANKVKYAHPVAIAGQRVQCSECPCHFEVPKWVVAPWSYCPVCSAQLVDEFGVRLGLSDEQAQALADTGGGS